LSATAQGKQGRKIFDGGPVGIFKRKSELDGLTAEFEGLRHRRSQLTAMLTAAEQRLSEAVQDRQTKLLESDLATGGVGSANGS
jgi:hypothetical protein